MCKYRGETPLSQRWMAETMIKAGFYMRWPCCFPLQEGCIFSINALGPLV
jgi:hypothetical protein